MLNHRLEDLIYKYRSYRIKKFIKNISTLVVFIIVAISLYVLYKQNSVLKNHKHEQKHKQKEHIVIKEKNVTIKPAIKKVDTPKKIHKKVVKLNEEKILKKNTFSTLMMIEKNKPTYQSAYDLAKYYFENKNYKLSAKWAVVAQNREPKVDKAWILYAKSKIKLGQKGMAKKALKIYLIKYHSREVSNLLNSL